MKPWLLAPILVLIDQLTKSLARTELLEASVQIFPGAHLRLAFNKGFAFSLPAPQIILILLAIGVSGFLVHWTSRPERTIFEKWAAVLVASGAIGNAIDRILVGQVTDFLAFWTFPIFNFADICVSLGVVILLIGELKNLNLSPDSSCK